MSYLRNVWYVAAWASEVKPGRMLTRTLLEERVLMFRDEAGEARALFDQCPHRFAPLSMGKLCDGGRYVQCGYHGLQFDGKGACVSNPHGAVPKAAKVKSDPLVERYSVLWIWMGDPEQADPASMDKTHYFFSLCYPKAMGTMGEELAQRNTAGLRAPFLYEDKPMVEAQQRQMAGRSFWDMKPLLLDVDAPAVRARRVLEQLIAAEGKQPSASH